MGVKKHVFGSTSERAYYYKLSKRWEPKYRLYHNLPFLQVFDTNTLLDLSSWPKEPPKTITISDRELGWLKKTSTQSNKSCYANLWLDVSSAASI